MLHKFFISFVCALMMGGILSCKPASDSSSETLAKPSNTIGGKLLCLGSQNASKVALLFSIACWLADVPSLGTATPICIGMTSAAVTVSKIGNSAYQCLNGCGLAGAVCEEVMAKKQLRKVGLLRTGCTKNGEWSVVGDACSAGMNHSWGRNDPESRGCDGTPTGWWALSESERNRISDPSSCGN